MVSNPKILEVNLIKSDSGVDFDWGKNLTTAVLVFFIAAAVIAEIYFGLDWWQKQEIANTAATEKEIAALKHDITALNNQADEAMRYKDKVVALSGLLNNHVYWTNYLSWLEKNTLSSVQYETLSGDTSGVYSFNAVSKTYADVSWQTKAFLNDPMTKKVTVDLAASTKSKDKGKESGPQVNFTINLEVNPAIFKK